MVEPHSDLGRVGPDDGADDLGPVAVVLGMERRVDLGVHGSSGARWSRTTSRSTPPARIRPRPWRRARRYQALSGPYAERT